VDDDRLAWLECWYYKSLVTGVISVLIAYCPGVKSKLNYAIYVYSKIKLDHSTLKVNHNPIPLSLSTTHAIWFRDTIRDFGVGWRVKFSIDLRIGLRRTNLVQVLDGDRANTDFDSGTNTLTYNGNGIHPLDQINGVK
jgi:hypothetical protein